MGKKNYKANLYQIVVYPANVTYKIMSDQLGFYRVVNGTKVSPLRHNRTIEAIQEIETRHHVMSSENYLSIEVSK